MTLSWKRCEILLDALLHDNLFPYISDPDKFKEYQKKLFNEYSLNLEEKNIFEIIEKFKNREFSSPEEFAYTLKQYFGIFDQLPDNEIRDLDLLAFISIFKHFEKKNR